MSALRDLIQKTELYFASHIPVLEAIRESGSYKSHLQQGLERALEDARALRQDWTQVKADSDTLTEQKEANASQQAAASLSQAATDRKEQDAEKLFFMDSQPGDVDELMRKFKSQTGEKRARSSDSTSKLAGDEMNAARPQSKRNKLKTPDGNQTTASPNEIDKQYQAFERKVELRLKEKDKQQDAKSNKKRKRTSDGPALTEPAHKPTIATTTHRSKKRKMGNGSLTGVGNALDAPTPMKRQVEATTEAAEGGRRSKRAKR